MDTNPLRTTLDTLRTERESAERRAIELNMELQYVGQRLLHLRGAIENIEALLGVPSVEDEEILSLASDEPAGATVREIDFTNTPATPPSGVEDDLNDYEPYEPITRKRVPSTEWVAQVVEAIGGPADRDTVFEAFRQIKGFPPTWTNPRNSVNNALGRAVERGLVRKVEENLFAPLGYKPYGSDTVDREES
jgi:hypothetical protein